MFPDVEKLVFKDCRLRSLTGCRRLDHNKTVKAIAGGFCCIVERKRLKFIICRLYCIDVFLRHCRKIAAVETGIARCRARRYGF